MQTITNTNTEVDGGLHSSIHHISTHTQTPHGKAHPGTPGLRGSLLLFLVPVSEREWVYSLLWSKDNQWGACRCLGFSRSAVPSAHGAMPREKSWGFRTWNKSEFAAENGLLVTPGGGAEWPNQTQRTKLSQLDQSPLFWCWNPTQGFFGLGLCITFGIGFSVWLTPSEIPSESCRLPQLFYSVEKARSLRILEPWNVCISRRLLRLMSVFISLDVQ